MEARRRFSSASALPGYAEMIGILAEQFIGARPGVV